MSEKQKHIDSQRRKQKYKEILERGTCAAEEREGHSVAENFNIIERMLTDSDKLITDGNPTDRIGHTTEVLMDVQVVKMACDLMGSTIQQIDNVKFSDEQYAAAITRTISDDNGQLDWSKLDAIATSVIASFKYTPAVGDAGIKFDELDETQSVTQKQRQVRKKTELAAETKPTSLTQQQVGEKDMGTKKLREISQQIKKLVEKNNHEPIPYYQLVIDPKNMMNTFDNGFQMSFLFRDGIIGFEYDKHHMPAIRWISEGKQKKQTVENKQFIVKLDSKIIGEMIKRYKITKPLLNIDRELYDELDASR